MSNTELDVFLDVGENLRHDLIQIVKTALCDTTDYWASVVADQLILHGVTIQEWISVDDELPKEEGFYRVFHKNSKMICDRFYYKDCPDLFVNVLGDPISHWAHLPVPPQKEVNDGDDLDAGHG